MVMQSSDIPELSSYTDPVIETTITGDDTPLASKPKVTTKTKRKTKTTRKKVKLKKASKKSYTKKLPKKKKTTTKTRKSGKKTVKTQTTVQTATTREVHKEIQTESCHTENSNNSQDYNNSCSFTAECADAGSFIPEFRNSELWFSKDLQSEGIQAYDQQCCFYCTEDGQQILNAYARMGFTVTVDPNAAYAGHFDARSRSITIQEADETIYHELGHFLAFIAGNVDQSSAFASVYNSEKAKFTGYNKAYATQNAAEYFAESVKDYMLNGAALSSQRPQ